MKGVQQLEWSQNRSKGLISVCLIVFGILIYRQYLLDTKKPIEIVVERQEKRKFSKIDFQPHSTEKQQKKKNIYSAIDINHADSLAIVSLPQIGPKITSRILKYRAKSGGFKNWEDLLHVYGMEERETSLRDLIYFGEYQDNNTRENNLAEKQEREYNKQENIKTGAKPTLLVSLNTADSVVLEALPGIGSVMASRIIKFREKLGGFYTIEQLKEVYGLKSENYEKFSNQIQLGQAIQKIDLQQVSLEKLAQHPYCGWKIAKIIIAYREQHQGVQWSEIEQMPMLDSSKLAKLKHYIK